jgi:hypothetical protein
VSAQRHAAPPPRSPRPPSQGFCGYWSHPQGGCSALSASQLTAMQTANNGMLQQMVTALNAAGIIPILSSINRFEATVGTPPCALPEDATAAALNGTVYARFYENWPSSYWTPDGPELEAAMIENAILEGEMGIPVLVHAYVNACPDAGRNITRPGRLGGPFEYQLAAFLVAQTQGSVFSVSNDWYDGNFCWHPEYDVLYGAPLAPPVRTSATSWTRAFTGCNVTLDTTTRTAIVYLL